MRLSIAVTGFVLSCLAAAPAQAQTAPAQAQAAPTRVYSLNPANEDWSFLKDPSKRVDFWDPVKYIAFGRDEWFMTLSGEIRYRPEGFRIEGTDKAPTVVDNYLLQRYLFGADVHMGPRARVFVELQSAVVNGKLGGPGTRTCSISTRGSWSGRRRVISLGGSQCGWGVRSW